MFQKIEIIGYLGRDPELRYIPSGQAVCNYSVAASRKWTDDQGNKHEETTWWRVTTWGKQAENDNQYLAKGSLVRVVGRPNQDAETGGPRVWQAQDGSWRANWEMTAFEVLYLTRGENNNGHTEQQAQQPETPAPEIKRALPEDQARQVLEGLAKNAISLDQFRNSIATTTVVAEWFAPDGPEAQAAFDRYNTNKPF